MSSYARIGDLRYVRRGEALVLQQAQWDSMANAIRWKDVPTVEEREQDGRIGVDDRRE